MIFFIFQSIHTKDIFRLFTCSTLTEICWDEHMLIPAVSVFHHLQIWKSSLWFSLHAARFSGKFSNSCGTWKCYVVLVANDLWNCHIEESYFVFYGLFSFLCNLPSFFIYVGFLLWILILNFLRFIEVHFWHQSNFK